jgi:hypothetical protein
MGFVDPDPDLAEHWAADVKYLGPVFRGSLLLIMTGSAALSLAGRANS